MIHCHKKKKARLSQNFEKAPSVVFHNENVTVTHDYHPPPDSGTDSGTETRIGK